MRRIGLLLILPLFVLNGCAEVCRPKYNPTQVLPCKVTDNRAARLQVVDGRRPKERYFARFDGWFVKFYEPDVRKYAQSWNFQLERPAVEILRESIEKAIVENGYLVSSDADTQINVELRKFLYTISSKNAVAEIEVDISVKKGETKIFTKTMSRYDDKPFHPFRQYQDGETVLSICLSNILKEIVCDAEIRNATVK